MVAASLTTVALASVAAEDAVSGADAPVPTTGADHSASASASASGPQPQIQLYCSQSMCQHLLLVPDHSYCVVAHAASNDFQNDQFTVGPYVCTVTPLKPQSSNVSEVFQLLSEIHEMITRNKLNQWSKELCPDIVQEISLAVLYC